MQEFRHAGGVQEFCHLGAGQPEVAGGAFLLELLEDTPAHADQPLEVVDDRLRRVMRSLEAEIGGMSAPAAAEESGGTADGLMSDDGGLEDMLSEFDGSPEAAEAPLLAAVPFEYWDQEVPPVAMGNDMGGWYVDGEGIVAGYEFREPCYYTYSEGSVVEQVYSPLCLWE